MKKRIEFYTDQELDNSSNLYNYDARLYDPVIGRFVSADSIIPNVYDPQDLNKFSYCGNNPLIYIDPDGHARKMSKILRAYKLNKVTIRNKKLAGGRHPHTKIPFDKDGFPDFSSVRIGAPVKIEMTGNHAKDAMAANKQAGYNKKNPQPENTTWHHHQDGETMELVPTDIHNKTGHTGGAKTVKIMGEVMAAILVVAEFLDEVEYSESNFPFGDPGVNEQIERWRKEKEEKRKQEEIKTDEKGRLLRNGVVIPPFGG